MSDAIDRRELAFKALAGLLGGAVGWIPVELASHGHSLTEQQSSWTIAIGIISMAIVAGVIGGMINATDSNDLALTPRVKRRFLLGFSVCLVLAIPESYYSDVIFSEFLSAGGWSVNHPGSMVYLIAGRLVGWSMMGLMLGIGVGLASFSFRNILRGALGGIIGGFVGGAAFDIVGSFSQTGLASRLIGFCLIGFAIAFFIGLVHQLTKSAWLAVDAGRLKGRQYRLEGATMMLGRAEENAVGLFGDPSVQARHAIIEHKGERYTLKNLAVQAGTMVNGARVETVELHPGDRIKIGDYELTFHVRAERAASESAQVATTVAAPTRRPAHVDTVFSSGVGTGKPVMSSNPGVAKPVSASNGSIPYLRGPSGQHFEIRADAPTRIGRALDNDIVLNDASVSRYHASIEARNGGFVLRDLGSQNGSWLGEQRVTETPLGPGDILKFGDAVFTFHA
ncbi:MAG TPA: FHA domain-containing protein [Candidatus Binataceae bacterium]|nr:FHA domain-containing protein [Candidatus Binataceae bacterium]